MIRILPLAMGAFVAAACGPRTFAQQRTVPSQYGSPSGFGSVLYPGTGHAPVTRPVGNISDPTFASRLGGSVRGAPLLTPPRISHPSHGRRVVVPYPVFVGGYYGGFDAAAPGYYQEPAMGYAPQPPAPAVVIINQGYRPETINPVVRDYSDVNLPETSTVRTYEAPAVRPLPDPKEVAERREQSERPTIYLIAFKDHTILPAVAYWMEGDTLNYVTQEGKPNRVSMELIDREFSRQLNRERNVEFKLP